MTPGLRVIVLRRVLAWRCPQCGKGRIFRGYARVAERCDACGLVFRREQGAQTGSMYLTAAVTQVFAALLIGLAWVFTDWSVALFLSVSLPLGLAFCFAFLPVSQALWCGVEYITDVVNNEDWADPRP